MKNVLSLVLIAAVSCSVVNADWNSQASDFAGKARTGMSSQGIISKEQQQAIRLNQLKAQLDEAIKNNAANINDIKSQIKALEKDMKKAGYKVDPKADMYKTYKDNAGKRF